MTNSAAICLVVLISCMCFTYGGAHPEPTCPPLYTYTMGDNSCIRVRDDMRVSMKEAKEECFKDNNGILLEMKSNQTKDLVNGMSKSFKRYWVGLERTDSGHFQFLSGASMTNDVLSWASGQPNNFKKTQNCVELIVRKNGALNDKRCDRKRPFICQILAKQDLPIGFEL